MIKNWIIYQVFCKDVNKLFFKFLDREIDLLDKALFESIEDK